MAVRPLKSEPLMPLSESGSLIAIGFWAATWLPGLAFAAWRMERLLRAARWPRALLEPIAVLSAPLLAFGLYALSDAQRYAQAHRTQVPWSTLWSVAQVAVPYAVSAGCLWAIWRPGTAHTKESRWWIAFLLGLLSAIVLTPGLLMAQLMVFVGN